MQKNLIYLTYSHAISLYRYVTPAEIWVSWANTNEYQNLFLELQIESIPAQQGLEAFSIKWAFCGLSFMPLHSSSHIKLTTLLGTSLQALLRAKNYLTCLYISKRERILLFLAESSGKELLPQGRKLLSTTYWEVQNPAKRTCTKKPKSFFKRYYMLKPLWFQTIQV